MIINKTFTNWLEERYIRKNEYSRIPITINNLEESFKRYLERLGVWGVIELADKYVEDVKNGYHKN